jgi:hypothetical protein
LPATASQDVPGSPIPRPRPNGPGPLLHSANRRERPECHDRIKHALVAEVILTFWTGCSVKVLNSAARSGSIMEQYVNNPMQLDDMA